MFCAAKGLIKTEGCQHHVGFFVGEVLVEGGKIFRPGLQADFICRPRKVADAKFVTGVLRVQQAFEVSEILCPIEQGVPNEGNPVSGVEFEGERRGGCGNETGLRGGFFVKPVLGKVGGEGRGRRRLGLARRVGRGSGPKGGLKQRER